MRPSSTRSSATLWASARNAAAEMLHVGHTVLAVALALRDGYGLSPAQVTKHSHPHG
jgi:hypothetical protein